MTDQQVSSLLPGNATPWETAHELTDAARWAILDIASIPRNVDPLTCAPAFINLVAWQRSVDLWYDDWSIEKRRNVADRWFDFERLKGTEAGHAAFQSLVGGNLLKAVTPPQHVYAVDGWTDAERDAYLSQLDEVRVHRFYPVDLDADGLFASDAFADEDFFNSEPSYFGYRKAAFLVRPDGTQVDLTLDWQTEVSAEGVSTEIERIVLPAKPDAGIYAGADFLDEDFLDRDGVAERVIEITSAGAYRTTYGRQQFGVVFPNGERVAVEPVLISEIGPPDPVGTFAGEDFFDHAFLMPDSGWQQIFERYYIANPDAIVGPADAEGCYFDDARFGIAPHSAELTIELTGRQIEIGADEYFDEGFLLPPELEGWNRLLDASEAAKTFTDTVLIDTATRRFPRLGDAFRLDGSWPLGEMIKDR